MRKAQFSVKHLTDVVGGHVPHRLRLQETFAIEFSGVGYHLCELEIIFRSADEASRSREIRFAREPIRILVGYKPRGRFRIERDQARTLRVSRKMRRVLHPERIENPSLKESLVVLS